MPMHTRPTTDQAVSSRTRSKTSSAGRAGILAAKGTTAQRSPHLETAVTVLRCALTWPLRHWRLTLACATCGMVYLHRVNWRDAITIAVWEGGKLVAGYMAKGVFKGAAAAAADQAGAAGTEGMSCVEAVKLAQAKCNGCFCTVANCAQ